ncbi:unnamed protein product [Durusdinium trenchii]|uniref:TPR and ankyrin repeat-containing protein 1 n=2 Tax=Durusdinium trenchii TaxID=1381693 RepID=A0ABP0K3Y6_9DINO
MQAALSRRLPANTHVFDNIMDIFGDGRAWQAAFMQKGSFAEKVHMKNHAPCVREAYCVAHRQMCPLQTFCSARVGGTPCQDFSMSGNRLGLAGPQLPPLLAFGAKTEALRTPVVGLECVSELPTHVVHDAFGRNYDWPMANNLRPSNVGFPCTNRLRLYMGGVRADTTTVFFDPNHLLDYTHHLCQREPELRPRSLLVLSTDEHVQEDVWNLKAARRASPNLCSEGAGCYLRAELQRGRAYWERYESLPPDARRSPWDLVVHVGDNPAGTATSKGWCTWSAKSNALPTIRRRTGLYLALCHNRHLLLRELFLSMGYPTYPLASQVTGVPQYSVFLDGLTYFDSLRSLGNSFHVAQAGTAIGSLMLCCQIGQRNCVDPGR